MCHSFLCFCLLLFSSPHLPSVSCHTPLLVCFLPIPFSLPLVFLSRTSLLLLPRLLYLTSSCLIFLFISSLYFIHFLCSAIISCPKVSILSLGVLSSLPLLYYNFSSFLLCFHYFSISPHLTSPFPFLFFPLYSLYLYFPLLECFPSVYTVYIVPSFPFCFFYGLNYFLSFQAVFLSIILFSFCYSYLSVCSIYFSYLYFLLCFVSSSFFLLPFPFLTLPCPLFFILSFLIVFSLITIILFICSPLLPLFIHSAFPNHFSFPPLYSEVFSFTSSQIAVSTLWLFLWWFFVL